MASAISSRIAGMPSGVPGTLIIRLGRPTAAHRRRASASVPAVSAARDLGDDASRCEFATVGIRHSLDASGLGAQLVAAVRI